MRPPGSGRGGFFVPPAWRRVAPKDLVIAEAARFDAIPPSERAHYLTELVHRYRVHYPHLSEELCAAGLEPDALRTLRAKVDAAVYPPETPMIWLSGRVKNVGDQILIANCRQLTILKP